jgi:DMSO/TMAO reductase YedYZ heme-binding membrane subunit
VTRAAAKRVAGRACAGTAAAVLAGIGASGLVEPYALARELVWIRGSGQLAFGALALALCVSPLGALAARVGRGPDPQLLAALRRALGITSACAALLHAALALATYLAGAWSAVLDVPFLRSGALALAVLVALLATSFPALVRALRIRLWKELHWLAFPALLLVLHHQLLSPFADRALVLGLAVALFGVVLARLLPGRRAPPPLV